ncbi:hypothetical protein Hanom_Chr04g00372111 [Helianthus anomalus]
MIHKRAFKGSDRGVTGHIVSMCMRVVIAGNNVAGSVPVAAKLKKNICIKT